ncbi:MAG: YggS family pyridoxal phosphate-dependent enzyme [Myxococcota bacterium]
MNDSASIATRLAAIQERIATAVARRGDGPAVALLGVSKRQPLELIEEAAAAGQLDFGENYAQELRDKRSATPDAQWRWHFIGALQRNKVKQVVGCALVHTIDRPELLPVFEQRAAAAGIRQAVLVQVNTADEAGKAGTAPAQLGALLDRFADLDHVHCRGLMSIPPQGTPEQTRPHFRDLRQLRDQHAAHTRPGVELHELSMGMSADFEVAIEEGATIVRVGTALFGPRPAPAA